MAEVGFEQRVCFWPVVLINLTVTKVEGEMQEQRLEILDRGVCVYLHALLHQSLLFSMTFDFT